MRPRKRLLKNKDLNLEDLIAEKGPGGEGAEKQVLIKRLERFPIRVLVLIFVSIAITSISYLGFLTTSGQYDYQRALYRNRLASEIVFAPRGAILDKNEKNIASSTYDEEFNRYERVVSDIPGIGNLIGFIRYPEKDSSGYYWRFSTEGISGLEKYADNILREYPGYHLTTRERKGVQNEFPEDRIVYPKAGKPIQTTLDYDLTKVLGESLQTFIKENNYEGGAGLIMDVRTGELLSLLSFPDIDVDALSRNDEGIVEKYTNDPLKPFINRAVFGGYSPGSTVKPYLVAAFLNEKIITPTTTVDSTGSIKVVSQYDSSQEYIFRDWRPEGHGMTNARWALADSVNTFFYTFGGGYGNKTGLGIKKMKEYLQKFGLGEPVPFVIPGTQPGQVPDPAWKLKTFKETWRLGDTYNSSIGQYGFIVTPLQQLRAIAALATSGLVIDPIILTNQELHVSRINGIEERWYEEVRAGMRDVVTKGTGKSLGIPEIEVAAKTGTAQVANKTKINSWAIGFWPYNNPQYAFVLLAERGPKEGAPGVANAFKPVLKWIVDQRTVYFTPAPGYEDVKNSPPKIEKESTPEIKVEEIVDEAITEDVGEIEIIAPARDAGSINQ